MEPNQLYTLHGYKYGKEGIWEPIDDMFPAFTSNQYLVKMGYRENDYSSGAYEKVTCRLGEMRIYAAVKLNPKWPYLYLCVVYIGVTPCRIWLDSFPSLICLLKEVDAHPSQATLTETAQELAPDVNFNYLFHSLETLLTEAWSNGISVVIKPDQKSHQRKRGN